MHLHQVGVGEMQHPYKEAPDRSFWSRAVSRQFKASELFAHDGPLIRQGDRIVSAGSCFAANLVPYLKRYGLNYVKTELPHRAFNGLGEENLGYAKFSAAYGNIYTARQLLQLLRRCDGSFRPLENRWVTTHGIIDPYRPGLKYHALSFEEFDALQQQHFRCTLDAFSQADVFIYTLGLTETWISGADGAVFPACPGTVAGNFDLKRHLFHNFTMAEIVADLVEFIEELRKLAPRVSLVLTVSPVPLVATATGQHVLCASTYSKSVLRGAAQQACEACSNTYYFPSYEIITGPQAPPHFFEKDRREVSAAGIDAVMSAFLSHCEIESDGHEINSDKTEEPNQFALISKAISDAACEEVMVE
jgi:hypothetical protein